MKRTRGLLMLLMFSKDGHTAGAEVIQALRLEVHIADISCIHDPELHSNNSAVLHYGSFDSTKRGTTYTLELLVL